MSALDQSLDDIISSKPKKQFKKKQQIAKSKVGKASVKKTTPTGPKKQATKVTKAAAKPSSTILDASYANKVIVYGLPKDIKNDAVKDFFASQVGGVSSVALTYNEKGQSKGIATVIFKSSVNANKAVEKYNGAPIDGGVTKLRLELIIDPTKKPLASRILANAIATTPKKKEQSKPKTKATGNAKQPAKQQTKKAAKPKTKRPAKKTVEQLDQEMADYFDKKD